MSEVADIEAAFKIYWGKGKAAFDTKNECKLAFQAGAAYQASQPPCGEARSNDAGMTADAVEKVRLALSRALETFAECEPAGTHVVFQTEFFERWVPEWKEALALLPAPRQEVQPTAQQKGQDDE